LFGTLLHTLGIRTWPWLVLLLWALLALSLWHLPLGNDPPHAEHDAVPVGTLAVLRRPEVAWFFAGVFLTVLAHVSLYAFFALFAASYGMSESTIGLLWSVGVLVEIGFFWTQGHWFERLSMHNWLLLAAGVSALRFAAMAAFGHWMVVLVLTQMTHAITFEAQNTAGEPQRSISTPPASRWCRVIFRAGCVAAARRCTPRSATGCRAWSVASPAAR
jgi:PPP family 3-phenylpropionic acid transporter